MSKLYYSTVADYQLEDGILNVYVPVTEDTKELIQALYDLRKPRNEYFDTSNEGHLVAVEWYFPSGQQILKKLQNSNKWKEVFNEVGNSLNTPLKS